MDRLLTPKQRVNAALKIVRNSSVVSVRQLVTLSNKRKPMIIPHQDY